MPLAINEIGVQLALGKDEPAESAPTAAAAPGTVTLTPEQREAIVQDCVQRVLAQLKAAEAR